ncbi:MAG: hypothetical protein A2074_04905 [Candidatus Aquicultor primus]|uniref:Uncharacterized protein n=1 Tax=Candidatus Aquicultor primus TaxID=1797195 RepID=A0A1F2UKG5_9ACTN|nr:MAG: hypothetical protein A2074_04905 [Candidatus Aquicultor primus]HCG98485.1 hypothetical protein [Actinomycetota bacterium]
MLANRTYVRYNNDMEAAHSSACLYCGIKFDAQLRELKRGNAKFCSRSCAAAFGNKLRKKELVPNLTCHQCGNEFYRKPSLSKSSASYCSERCFREASGRAFSKEKILRLIRGFVDKQGRIPTQVEFSHKRGWLNPSTVVGHFGSWNKAIEEAGFLSNSASIGYVCFAKDGHLCRSYSELLIDDWLTDNGVRHDKEVKYPGSRLVADWKVGNMFIEYLGIDTRRDNVISRNYLETLERKRRICLALGVRLLELRPDDLKSIEIEMFRYT